jgi:hypothetical protein
VWGEIPWVQHSSIPIVDLYMERLAVNAKVAKVLGSITASSDTVKSEGRQMKQCGITYIKECLKERLLYVYVLKSSNRVVVTYLGSNGNHTSAEKPADTQTFNRLARSFVRMAES